MGFRAQRRSRAPRIRVRSARQDRCSGLEGKITRSRRSAALRSAPRSRTGGRAEAPLNPSGRPSERSGSLRTPHWPVRFSRRGLLSAAPFRQVHYPTSRFRQNGQSSRIGVFYPHCARSRSATRPMLRNARTEAAADLPTALDSGSEETRPRTGGYPHATAVALARITIPSSSSRLGTGGVLPCSGREVGRGHP